MTDQNPIEEEGPKSLSQWAQEINEIGNTKWVEFYAEMLGTRPTNMGRFIRAIKLYGFFPVFEAIVDMSSRDLTGDPLNYFNKVAAIDYDYIGLSYYPIHHGKSLVALQNTMNSLGRLHNKKVIIAETSYPFTFGYNDYTNNIIGLDSQIIPAFPATNTGQRGFLSAIKNTVKQSSHGIGFCYWGSEWVAFRGPTAANGSTWENQALWDFTNNSLPVMDVFNAN